MSFELLSCGALVTFRTSSLQLGKPVNTMQRCYSWFTSGRISKNGYTNYHNVTSSLGQFFTNQLRNQDLFPVYKRGTGLKFGNQSRFISQPSFVTSSNHRRITYFLYIFWKIKEDWVERFFPLNNKNFISAFLLRCFAKVK